MSSIFNCTPDIMPPGNGRPTPGRCQISSPRWSGIRQGRPGPAVPRLEGSQHALVTFVDALFLRLLDAFALTFSDNCSFKFGKRSHHAQEETGHRGIIAGKRQRLLDKLNPHTPRREVVHQAPEIVEVASQAVDGVDNDRVPLPGIPEEFLQLGTVPSIFAAGLVGEDTVQFNTVELTVGVLID